MLGHDKGPRPKSPAFLSMYKEEVSKMYCRNCGKEIPDKANFCKYCGTPVVKRKNRQPVSSADPVEQGGYDRAVNERSVSGSSVSREQFTRNASAFCDRIKKAGYKPMVYANMLWEAYSLDLSALTDIPVWYADYEKLPQTPYDFDFWQYSNEGVVPGISGACDMDIQIIAGQ